MWSFLFLLTYASSAYAIGQDTCVSFTSSPSAFALVTSSRTAAPVITAEDDWPGVHRAASDFVTDIQRVTGTLPSLSNYTSSSAGYHTPPVLVGTLGHSTLIANILNHTNLDVSSVQGKWEAFMSVFVKNPLPGLDSAYVIIGADKRGTIFALYDHSEQFGVSPWYWCVAMSSFVQTCVKFGRHPGGQTSQLLNTSTYICCRKDARTDLPR